MNAENAEKYVSVLNLPDGPIDSENAEILMATVAKNIGRTGTGARLGAARYIMSKYRSGDFGQFLLDDVVV